MRIGEVGNEGALANGKPLDGVKVLALEQYQALPFATQLLGRLGADVVKVEKPGAGESGRGSLPAMLDPDGRPVGATFLRNNLNKKSVAIDIKTPQGRDLVLQMADRYDVLAENFRPGVVDDLGLGYEDVRRIAPRTIYLSLSGFGSSVESPYRSWSAYAPVAEAMSGIYEMKRPEGRPPVVVPLGGVGDIAASLVAVVGVLAALRHRDRTRRGQLVDVSMMDSMVAMTDLVVNFWSMGLSEGALGPQIMDGFEASDGWFVLIVLRENEFVRLAHAVGHPEWLDDPRLSTRAGWVEHLEDVLRPDLKIWASTRTRREVCEKLAGAGVAAAPCLRAAEVATDPHLAARDMIVEMERTDGVPQPILLPGNPVRLSDMAIGPETRVPWVGEHTDEVLAAELQLNAGQLATLRARGVIG